MYNQNTPKQWLCMSTGDITTKHSNNSVFIDSQDASITLMIGLCYPSLQYASPYTTQSVDSTEILVSGLRFLSAGNKFGYFIFFLLRCMSSARVC